MAKKNCLNDFDQRIFNEILQELCEKSRFCQSKSFIQHGNTTLYEHNISVAYVSYRVAVALRLRINMKELIRGALLHDYFLYDWHIPDPERPLHGFYHPKLALKNAETEFELSEVERDIILRHMFPLTIIPPRCKEGLLVCLADKVCSLNEILRRGSRGLVK